MKEVTGLSHGFKITGTALNFICNSALSKNPFKQLAEFSSDIFLVHLRQRAVVDRIVVVEMSRRLILDSEEL